MTTLNVQFSDSSKTAVSAFFGCLQDPEGFPNQGQIEVSDPLWAKFYDSMPDFVQASLPAPEAG